MSDYRCSLGGFQMSLIQQQGISGGFVKDLSNKQLTRTKHAEYFIYELLIQYNIMFATLHQRRNHNWFWCISQVNVIFVIWLPWWAWAIQLPVTLPTTDFRTENMTTQISINLIHVIFFHIYTTVKRVILSPKQYHGPCWFLLLLRKRFRIEGITIWSTLLPSGV